jgi:hypothetical protein
MKKSFKMLIALMAILFGVDTYGQVNLSSIGHNATKDYFAGSGFDIKNDCSETVTIGGTSVLSGHISMLSQIKK